MRPAPTPSGTSGWIKLLVMTGGLFWLIGLMHSVA